MKKTQQLNGRPHEGAELQVVTSENLKKNRFVAVSLLNAATTNWSYRPLSLVNETEDSVSLPSRIGQRSPLPSVDDQTSASFGDDIGTYRALLARDRTPSRGRSRVSCLLKKPAFGVWPCGSCERNCKRKAFRFLRFQRN